MLGHRWHATTAGYAHLAEAAERVGSTIAEAMARDSYLILEPLITRTSNQETKN